MSAPKIRTIRIIAELAHGALSRGKRKNDWCVLSQILGICNGEEVRHKKPLRRIVARRAGKS